MRSVLLAILFIIVTMSSAVWLSYCTNDPASLAVPSFYYGVRFTPPSNSGLIARVSAYCNAAYHLMETAPIGIHLFHVVNGTPTELIHEEFTYISGYGGWRTFNIYYQWEGGSETEFLMAVQPMSEQVSPVVYGVSYLYMDSQIDTPNRNWKKPVSGGVWQQNTTGGDYMICVEICCVGVDASSVGRIKSVFHKD